MRALYTILIVLGVLATWYGVARYIDWTALWSCRNDHKSIHKHIEPLLGMSAVISVFAAIAITLFGIAGIFNIFWGFYGRN